MQYGNINDITNLKFYTDKGTELPVQKSYVLRWELIPGKFAQQYLQEIPTGYFIGDVDLSGRYSKEGITIAKGTFIAGIINTGKFFVRMSQAHSTDINGLPIFAYSERETEELDSAELYNYVERILFDVDNQVKVIIEDNNIEYTNTFNVNDIFAFDNSVDYSEYVTIQEVFTGNNLFDSKEYFLLLGVNHIDLVQSYSDDIPYIQQVLRDNVPNIGLYFPFVRYNMNMYQDKVSADFIAANTMLVLEHHIDNNGNDVYEKPYIDSDNPYVLLFQPTVNSEIQIISNDSEYNIRYMPEAEFSLADPDTSDNVTPLSFSFGFQSKEEGAYQNLIGIYMRSLDNYGKNVVFFMGCISVKTEVEGEDERFRTLLTNFGVPDPVLYSNLFAEQDYQEEGKDYTLINKKSKELFLTYSEIFSYVGTYKALIKAIKFLGYTDIIFKEWYTLKDSNDKETDVAVQVFDSESGEFLKSKLAEYGVSIEDFERYNKINKISMIYHLNERDELNYERIEQILMKYPADPTKPAEPDKKYTLVTEVPLTKPIYTYRNAEILAKLFAVKKWLEYNIIGIGAYITDISGEGIYFGWQKTQGYETTHHLADFSQEQYYTADVKCVLPFVESQGKIACTLNELNDAIRLEDYMDVPLEAFIRNTLDISFGDVSVFYASNTLETPVLGDEYEFELSITPDSGTLYEWSQETEQQLIVDSGEIKMLFNDKLNETVFDSSCLPIITLENANIHLTTGKWTDNVIWAINEVIDPMTGNVHHKLKNIQTGLSCNMYSVINKRYFILKPATEDAYIKYTDNNNWEVPMFIIKGYDIVNINVDNQFKEEYTVDLDKEYILEILKGDILFKRINNVGAKLLFSNDNIEQEQSINVNYTYYSDRLPFVNYDSSLYDELEAGATIDPSTYDDIINNSIDKIDRFNEKLKSDIKSFPVSDQYVNTAYIEADEYMKSDEYKAADQEFIDKKREQLELADACEQYEDIYNEYYHANKTIDVDVNRLGEYSVISKAYDKYNNMFVSKYDKTANVSVKPIAIDVFTDSNKSNNSESFYKDNIDGILCTSTMIEDILSMIDDEPLYPTNYKILDFQHDRKSNRLTFDNISYAYDTPKNNDYLVLDNNKDKVITFDGSDIDIADRHNDFTNRYDINDAVIITAYDQHKHKEYVVIESSIKDIITTDASLSIELNDSISDSYDNTLSYYIKNITQFTLNINHYIDSVDYENKQTVIVRHSDRNPFNIGDVIKLRYISTEMIIDPSTKEISYYDNGIINEAAYRIIDIKQEADDNIDCEYIGFNVYKYTLNGLVPNISVSDTEDNIQVYMMLANQYPVHYTTRIIGNAVEYNEHLGYNLNILKDELHYNTSQMLLDSYIDDNYSGYCYDYDLANLSKQWYNMNNKITPEMINDIDMYYYHNFPITVTKQNYLMFRDHDRENAFKDGYKVEWAVISKMLDERTNLNEYIKNDYPEVVFRSANRVLSIIPSIIGPQNVELTCTDIYGNKLINSGNCKLYVKNKE